MNKIGNITFIERRCESCQRSLERKMEGYEGEGWEIREQYRIFKKKCWVCRCKSDNGKRHTQVLNYAIKKEHDPCGC